ncbi:Hypothetical predicted protein [Paramuricea clavata]|uniref:Uncharacterized protein n=1 Tax=Paramuricea clavata TaxID=317549 RepID=A0A7D9LYM5_PARCT|nr:Hypothetical predicted protein [Paramuricea clavata]
MECLAHTRRNKNLKRRVERLKTREQELKTKSKEDQGASLTSDSNTCIPVEEENLSESESEDDVEMENDCDQV